MKIDPDDRNRQGGFVIDSKERKRNFETRDRDSELDDSELIFSSFFSPLIYFRRISFSGEPKKKKVKLNSTDLNPLEQTSNVELCPAPVSALSFSPLQSFNPSVYAIRVLAAEITAPRSTLNQISRLKRQSARACDTRRLEHGETCPRCKESRR